MSSGAADRPEREAEHDTAAAAELGDAAASAPAGAVSASRLAADHVHVETDAGTADDGADDRAVHELAPAGALSGTEDDLCRVEGPGGLHERLSHIGAGDLTVAAPKALDETALLLQHTGRRARPARSAAARARR